MENPRRVVEGKNHKEKKHRMRMIRHKTKKQEDGWDVLTSHRVVHRKVMPETKTSLRKDK